MSCPLRLRSVARPSARAFTLVEAVVSTIVVGTMFAAAVAAVGAAARDRRVQAEMRTGPALAQMLMSEILSRRFQDPDGSTTIGRDAGEDSSRTTWDDVDDYNGLDQSPPADRSGVDLPGGKGWRWTAAVSYIDVPAAPGSGATGGVIVQAVDLLGAVVSNVNSLLVQQSNITDLKRIEVTVTSPRGVQTRLVGLRSRWGAAGESPVSATIDLWASVHLQIGPESRNARIGVPLVNHPQDLNGP